MEEIIKKDNKPYFYSNLYIVGNEVYKIYEKKYKCSKL